MNPGISITPDTKCCSLVYVKEAEFTWGDSCLAGNATDM
jgi:hypothetical protein